MDAAIFEQGQFRVGHLPDPSPGPGQVLVRPLVCGVCGSDLHTRNHAHQLAGALGRAGFRGFMDPDLPAVMGHEFVCEIIDYGPGCTRKIGRGARVTGLPFITGANGVELIGYSNNYNGAMAEAMLLQEDMLFAVPDQVGTETAALSEPLAVAVHAVAAAQAGPDCAFAVFGCGPVGLFTIARLRHLGLGPILAIDPDAGRRAQAARLGADEVSPPDPDLVIRWWEKQGSAYGLSDDAAAAPGRRRPIVFECVGKPGMLQSVAQQSPMRAAIVVVGLCMEEDQIMPAYLLMKEMTLRFVFAYTQPEFAEAVAMISAAPEKLGPMVTGFGTLDQVGDVFDTLSTGIEQVKMMIRPDRSQ